MSDDHKWPKRFGLGVLALILLGQADEAGWLPWDDTPPPVAQASDPVQVQVQVEYPPTTLAEVVEVPEQSQPAETVPTVPATAAAVEVATTSAPTTAAPAAKECGDYRKVTIAKELSAEEAYQFADDQDIWFGDIRALNPDLPWRLEKGARWPAGVWCLPDSGEDVNHTTTAAPAPQAAPASTSPPTVATTRPRATTTAAPTTTRAPRSTSAPTSTVPPSSSVPQRRQDPTPPTAPPTTGGTRTPITPAPTSTVPPTTTTRGGCTSC